MRVSNIEGVFYVGMMTGMIGAHYAFAHLGIPFSHPLLRFVAMAAVGAAGGYVCELAYRRLKPPTPPQNPNDWSGPVL